MGFGEIPDIAVSDDQGAGSGKGIRSDIGIASRGNVKDNLPDICVPEGFASDIEALPQPYVLDAGVALKSAGMKGTGAGRYPQYLCACGNDRDRVLELVSVLVGNIDMGGAGGDGGNVLTQGLAYIRCVRDRGKNLGFSIIPQGEYKVLACNQGKGSGVASADAGDKNAAGRNVRRALTGQLIGFTA